MPNEPVCAIRFAFLRGSYRRALFVSVTGGVLLCAMIPGCGCNEELGRSVSGKVESVNVESPRQELRFVQEFVNSLGMRFRRIHAGEFMMGSDPKDDVPPEFKKFEPQRQIKIKRDFFIMTTEVTNEMFQRFASEGRYSGSQSGSSDELLRQLKVPLFPRSNQPIIFVSWVDATAFCEWLSRKEGRTYRLPTEEEWEYVCRAGKRELYGLTSDSRELLRFAWLKENADGVSHPVAMKLPNAWGLFDLNGNVWEWVATKVPLELTRATFGHQRCAYIRGGSYANGPGAARCAARWGAWPITTRSAAVGFRVVCGISGISGGFRDSPS